MGALQAFTRFVQEWLWDVKATRFNERLDARLMQTGVVDSKLFLDFASVESALSRFLCHAPFGTRLA